jgi:hypothetical protein
MRSLNLLASATALCAIAAGCASSDDINALRRPTLPPTQVALADRHSPLHENIAIYEIIGAPEFRLFDGGDIITTRPTRADVAHMLRTWLASADMLAEDIDHADYLLTVTFRDDLRGPDVIPFSDKRASATMHYRIEDRRSRDLVFEGEYNARMQARMPGVTPEMLRAAIAGGLIGAALGPDLAASDDPVGVAATAGALLGEASAAFAASHEMLLWDWPEIRNEALPRLADGLTLGAITGAIVADYDDTASDAAARWRGGVAGAAIGLLAAAPTGRRVDHWDSTEALGAFDGTRRRGQAVRGMMRQNFNRFLFGLEEQDLIEIRRAVTCDDLNPHGYGVALVTSDAVSVAYDCPIGRTRPLRPVG